MHAYSHRLAYVRVIIFFFFFQVGDNSEVEQYRTTAIGLSHHFE